MSSVSVSAHYQLIFSTKMPPIDFSCLIFENERELKITQKADIQGRKVKKRSIKNFAQKKHTFTKIASLQEQLIRLETNGKTLHS